MVEPAHARRVAPAPAAPAPARWWRSVRVRVTAGATIVFAVAFIGAAVLLVNRVNHSLEEKAAADSTANAAFIRQQLEAGTPVEEVLRTLPNPTGADVRDRSGRVLAVIPDRDAGGAGAVAPVPALPPPELVAGAGPGAGASFTEPVIVTETGASRAGGGGDVMVVRSEAATPNGPLLITTSSPLDAVRDSVNALTQVLVLGTPLLVALLGLVIWFFVGRALQPVDTMRAEVEEITHSTLHRRILPAGANDELDRLAHTMNSMLDRLEVAADRQSQFVSDASHELKTPLATIRTSIEVALRDPARADWTAIGQRVLAADAQMEDLVTDLLDLARLDELEEGDRTAERVPVDLEELVVDRVRENATSATIDVTAIVAGRVCGDRRGLDRLVRNLVTNATTHAKAQVRIGLEERDGWVELVVDDDGPGVDAADRDRIFARFTRLEASRVKARSAVPGAGGGPKARPVRKTSTGLGLAIVKAVVDGHGGTIAVGDAPLGGARFTVRLPAANGDAPNP